MPIPANDDALSSVRLIVTEVLSVTADDKKVTAKVEKPADDKVPVKEESVVKKKVTKKVSQSASK